MNVFETPADNALTGNGDGVSVFVRATKEDGRERNEKNLLSPLVNAPLEGLFSLFSVIFDLKRENDFVPG